MKNLDIPRIDVLTACKILGADLNERDILLLDESAIVETTAEPIRMGAFAAVLCKEGTAEISINMTHTVLHEMTLTIILPEQIICMNGASMDFKGKIAVISSEAITELIPEMENIKEHLFYLRQNNSIRVSAEEVETLEQYYSILIRKLDDKENAYTNKICRKLLAALFYEFCNIAKKDLIHISYNRKNFIFSEFAKAVNKYCKSHRKLAFYASELCITPKYLSSVIKEICGKSAGEWIDEAIIMEAKNLLVHSSMGIGEISDVLHFPDQSAFGKYFRNLTGVSPSGYRHMKNRQDL